MKSSFSHKQYTGCTEKKYLQLYTVSIQIESEIDETQESALLYIPFTFFFVSSSTGADVGASILPRIDPSKSMVYNMVCNALLNNLYLKYTIEHVFLTEN